MKFLQILSQIAVNPDDVNINKVGATGDTIANALKLVFGVAGAVALIIITIAGLQYVLSQGNPQSTAKAKDTILYAIVGLVICIFGFAIVQFVVSRVA